MPTPLAIVDAFTDRPFAGNPAAVCLIEAEAEAAWMQRVAAEMNLSETAFVRPIDAGFELRWFTPAAEVELCGHATLASAHLLWEDGRVPRDREIRFETRFRGALVCRRERTGGAILMDFPADPAEPVAPPAGLVERLGVRAVAVGRSRYDWIVELENEAEVLEARPDFPALAEFDTRGIAITARASRAGFDFVSRFFAPRLRIDEDPVTGSLHCVLAPYWAERLGRDELRAFQASPRGGALQLRLRGDRVELGGQAVTITRGELVA